MLSLDMRVKMLLYSLFFGLLAWAIDGAGEKIRGGTGRFIGTIDAVVY